MLRRSSAGSPARVRPLRPALESLERRDLLAAVVAEYAFAGPPAYPRAITAGPDGNLWFISLREAGGSIGRITTAGVITEFPLATPRSFPTDIASGPDGALWFTEGTATGPKIGRITTDGVVTEFPVTTASPLSSRPAILDNIAAGPDGALWFTENFSSGGPFSVNGIIGRITTDGVITEFPLPSQAYDITAGPDGALWYTALGPGGVGRYFTSPRIGRITTDGVITEFAIPRLFSQPSHIAAGPDGALWFTDNTGTGPVIGRITTAGVITEFAIPKPDRSASDITAGPDGALWFTEATGNRIGRITTDGVITEFAIPTPDSRPFGIAAGPDGDLWFTEGDAGKIGRLNPATPAPPTVTSVRRLGSHAEPTRIVVTFSSPLVPTRARDLRNYRIVGPGNRAVPIKSATYNPAANTVTLRPRTRLNLHRTYRLTVIGSARRGVADTSGVLLDGAGNGRPGSNFVATLRASNLVVGAAVPGGPRRLAALRRALA